MKTEKRPDGWWIADVPTYEVDGEICTRCGPYKTRDEADADLAGLTRFYADHPEYAGGTIPTPAPVPDPATDTTMGSPTKDTTTTTTADTICRPSPRATRRPVDGLTQRTLFG